MKIISCNFECPYMRHSIFNDSIPLKYKKDGGMIEFELPNYLPLELGEIKITYVEEGRA